MQGDLAHPCGHEAEAARALADDAGAAGEHDHVGQSASYVVHALARGFRAVGFTDIGGGKLLTNPEPGLVAVCGKKKHGVVVADEFLSDGANVEDQGGVGDGADVVGAADVDADRTRGQGAAEIQDLRVGTPGLQHEGFAAKGIGRGHSGWMKIFVAPEPKNGRARDEVDQFRVILRRELW